MKRNILILLALSFTILTVHSAEAQIVFGQKGYFSSSVVYASWTVKDSAKTELGEWVGVVRIFLPLADNLEMRFFSTGAAADLTNSSSEKRLSGMNDAKLQGAYSFADDAFLLTLGFSIPTGQKSLTQDEMEVANMLADNSMRFPVRRYGEGLDISTGLAMAQEVGGAVLGLGAGYLIKGDYALRDTTSDKYKPGDELVFSLGLDIKREKTLVRLDGIYTHFTKGKWAGKNFQKGKMYEVFALLNHAMEKTSIGLSLGMISRDKDRLPSETGLSYEQKNSHRNEYRGSLDLGYVLSDSWQIRGLLETRFLAANQYPKEDRFYAGSSRYYGGGARFDVRVAPRVKLNFLAKYFLGETDGGKKDLTGVNAEAGITVGF